MSLPNCLGPIPSRWPSLLPDQPRLHWHPIRDPGRERLEGARSRGRQRRDDLWTKGETAGVTLDRQGGHVIAVERGGRRGRRRSPALRKKQWGRGQRGRQRLHRAIVAQVPRSLELTPRQVDSPETGCVQQCAECAKVNQCVRKCSILNCSTVNFVNSSISN